MDNKIVDNYINLPYKVEIIRETDPEHSGWVARVLDLPGCITQGDTFEELGEMIEDAMRAWIETALERGIPVPEPRLEEEYSGKFVVRVPRSLHRQLVEKAEEEGVSLNQFINVNLAEGLHLNKSQLNKMEYPFHELASSLDKISLMTDIDFALAESTEKSLAEWLGGELQKNIRLLATGRNREASSEMLVLAKLLRRCGKDSPLLQVCSELTQLVSQLIAESKPTEELVTPSRDAIIEAIKQVNEATITRRASVSQTFFESRSSDVLVDQFEQIARAGFKK